MAPPELAAVSDDAMGLTQRELLMEMREDIKGLKATVDAIARDQAAGVERRAAMQRSADSIYARLDGHDRDLDRMLAWQNRADGAMVLARWALGASLVSLVAVALQVLAAVGRAVSGGIPRRRCRRSSTRTPRRCALPTRRRRWGAAGQRRRGAR
jgi:hypothetical protein